jgi:periplasmic mercuric ion binding protein
MARIFWVSALCAMLSGAHAGEPRRVMLDIPGMNCPVCPISVRKALERLPGVVTAKADLSSKSAEVTFDPDRISPERLAKAVSDAGYPATIRAQ